jgi:tetrahydromethanopterin S-methyltransferase subunit B
VPLSEDEQRILSQIEQQLYESDPELAREVGSTTVYSHAARNLKWAVFGFVVGLVFMVATLSITFWLAFLGFVIMLAAALYFEQNARRLGRAGMQQLSQTMRSGTLRNVMGGGESPGRSLRDRLRRDDDESSN